jgi:hypothetical protein
MSESGQGQPIAPGGPPPVGRSQDQTPGQAQTSGVKIEQRDGRSSNIPPKEGEKIGKRESLGNRIAEKFDELKKDFKSLPLHRKVAIILGGLVAVAAAICAGIFALPYIVAGIAAALAAFGVAAAVVTSIATAIASVAIAVGGISVGTIVGGAGFGIGKLVNLVKSFPSRLGISDISDGLIDDPDVDRNSIRYKLRRFWEALTMDQGEVNSFFR